MSDATHKSFTSLSNYMCVLRFSQLCLLYTCLVSPPQLLVWVAHFQHCYSDGGQSSRGRPVSPLLLLLLQSDICPLVAKRPVETTWRLGKYLYGKFWLMGSRKPSSDLLTYKLPLYSSTMHLVACLEGYSDNKSPSFASHFSPSHCIFSSFLLPWKIVTPNIH